MQQVLLHINAPVFLREGHVTVVMPTQPHRRIHVGGGALQGEPVSVENHLSLGGDELEQGHLQRSI